MPVKTTPRPDPSPPGHTLTLARVPVRPVEKVRSYTRWKRRAEVALAGGIPLLLIALWEVASKNGWIDERFYPAPSTCWAAAREMYESGLLWDAMSSTLYVVVTGFVLGSLAAFVIGAAMGTSRWVRVALEPLLNALYVIPKLALLPIFLTVFGLGTAPKVMLCAVTTFFFVWIATMEAIATVPTGYRDAAASFRVNRWQMFRHVELPAALPQIFVALRIGLGVSILAAIASEFVVGDDGLGYVIFNARALFLLEQAYAGIVIVAIMGIVLSAIVVFIGKLLTPWEQPRRRRLGRRPRARMSTPDLTAMAATR